MDYETASKAVGGGAKAYAEATSFFYEGMQKAVRKRKEIELLYGAAGLGVIETYTSGTPSITISAATFAPGIWSGLEGTVIDVQSGSTSTVRGSVSIVSVDIDTRIITLSGTVTGCVANDHVYFKGAYGNEMSGIKTILANTGSLFGISAATYSLWKASSKTVAAALTFADVKSAVAKAVGKGLDEDCVLLMNPSTWDNVLSDIAALRRTDKNEVKKVEIGAEEIVFHSQNGKIELIPSIYVKGGEAMGLCLDYWKRLGSADVTFGTPGFGGEMFRQLDAKAGIEARAYSHEAIFCEAPAKNFLITGIVNT